MEIPEIIRKILEASFWIPTIKTMQRYERIHDDHDGTYEGGICVMFSPDGDARLMTTGTENGDALRFRMPGSGGGMSPRVRTALLILAEAIRLDNEETPNTIDQT